MEDGLLENKGRQRKLLLPAEEPEDIRSENLFLFIQSSWLPTDPCSLVLIPLSFSGLAGIARVTAVV